jgi:capsular exopolysaccharide synthesis family protein
VVWLRILREHARLILGVSVIVTAAVAVGTLTRSPVYRASATLEIRRQAAEVVPVESFSQFERISDQYLQTQYAVLRGPALVRHAVSGNGLATRLWDASDEQPEPGTSTEMQTAALVAMVQEGLAVTPVAGSRLVRVSFESPDPSLATDLVNGIVAAYLAGREEAGTASLARLGQQTDSVRGNVLAAEAQLQQFVRDNALGSVVGPNQGETVPQERLRRLQQELTEVEAAAYNAESRATTASNDPIALASSELLTTLRSRVAELEGDYARLRATFTDSFPRTRQVSRELEQLRSMLSQEEQRIVTTLEGDHRATLRRRELLQAAVDEQRDVMDRLAGTLAAYERLRRDLDTQEQLYATLQLKQKEAGISAALSAMDVTVLDAATPPLAPVRPLPRRDIPLGAFAGLILGLGVAVLRHLTDRSIRTAQDMQQMSAVPVLAMIPAESPRQRLPASGSRSRQQWHRIDRPQVAYSALDEAFSGLRTSMLHAANSDGRRTLLITSSQPAEGKTTVSTNLAISLARLGRRVLLIDADLRRPSLHRVFAMGTRHGLADYMEGEGDWRSFVQSDVTAGLDVLTAGLARGNPADGLSSGRISQLLEEAQDTYDYVLLDAPALFISAPDARILAHIVDGVILVVRSGVATREVVQQLIGEVDNLIGVVLNEMDPRLLPAYYRDYSQPGAAHSQSAGRPLVRT